MSILQKPFQNSIFSSEYEDEEVEEEEVEEVEEAEAEEEEVAEEQEDERFQKRASIDTATGPGTPAAASHAPVSFEYFLLSYH